MYASVAGFCSVSCVRGSKLSVIPSLLLPSHSVTVSVALFFSVPCFWQRISCKLHAHFGIGVLGILQCCGILLCPLHMGQLSVTLSLVSIFTRIIVSVASSTLPFPPCLAGSRATLDSRLVTSALWGSALSSAHGAVASCPLSVGALRIQFR